MKKKILVFLLILISICAISNVSAADNSNSLAGDNLSDIETQIKDFDDSVVNSNFDCQFEDNKLGSVGNNLENIQDQIDNAEEGQTIYLEGEYTCNYLININKTINIIGKGEGATVRYNGSSGESSPFFYVNHTAPNVMISNIKFIGGEFLWSGSIYWQGDNGCLSNCEFIDSHAIGYNSIGGAVLIFGTDCNITNCTFTNNVADFSGGAILCNGTGGIISDCTFLDNEARGNHHLGLGGAIVIYGRNYTVKNCNFTGNHASDSGGAIVVLDKSNKIIDCEFYDNYISNNIDEDLNQSGGAICSYNELIIDNCTFIGNKALYAYAGAVSLSSNDIIKNSWFKNNKALRGNDLFFECNNIFYNHFVIDYNETVYDAVDVNLNLDELKELNNTFEKIKMNSSVTFSAGMIFEYGASGSIYVTVEGGIIEKENVLVLNHPEAKITYVNNLLTISNLPVGKYILHVSTTPDENHTSVSNNLSITVNQATSVIKASKLTVALKSGSVWKIKIVDSRNGKPIANMKVILKVYTGKKYKTVTCYTNSKGEISYNTKSLKKGTHKIVVSATHAGYKFTTLSSSIKVVKQTALKFKLQLKSSDKGGAILSYMALNKKTKKGINGIKVKVMIYTGKKYKTYVLKTKKVKGKKKTYNGAFGFATNAFSAGKHKVVIKPVSIKYKGSVKTAIKIKKSATKKPKYFRRV